MVELITSIDENLHNMIGASENSGHKEGRNSCCQREVKNLILLEDVDVTFVEDHGFIAAVKKIAEKAKQPIILTSNCKRLSDFNGCSYLQLCVLNFFLC